MDTFVLRDEDLFLVGDLNGEFSPDLQGSGLYMQDTRFLSEQNMLINNTPLRLLKKEQKNNHLSSFRWMYEEHDTGCLEVIKEPLISVGSYFQKITVVNYFPYDFEASISINFQADFQDMFIVRGFRNGQTGEMQSNESIDNGMIFRYRDIRGEHKQTRVSIQGDIAASFSEDEVFMDVHMKNREQVSFIIKVQPSIGNTNDHDNYSFEEALDLYNQKYEQWFARVPSVQSDDIKFNEMYAQAAADLQMLKTDVGFGETTVGGIPWYAVPFGRDSLISAMFMLSVDPQRCKGTLNTLAYYQGKQRNDRNDEEPGKIMHELRFGELSVSGQIPFTPYYGSVDATALYIILATEYYRWTKDYEFINQIKPSLDAAIDWLRSKEAEGDHPFVSYQKEAEKGLPNQGWKDSSNSMLDKSGSQAQSPIALIEVQGYVVTAKEQLGMIYKTLGYQKEADDLIREADAMKSLIDNYFWMSDDKFYALALDGKGEKIDSHTSNPGHLLMTEIKHASEVVMRLKDKDLNSGYGIRTMSQAEVGYNPMSYHNGSVWPHDNGMILMGMQRRGYQNEMELLMSQLIDATDHFENRRIPELFCGHNRGVDNKLIPYPTTCSPQAWSAAVSLLYVSLISGVEPDIPGNKITVKPSLPTGMNRIFIDQIPVGSGHLSLTIERINVSSEYNIIIENNSTSCDIDY